MRLSDGGNLPPEIPAADRSRTLDVEAYRKAEGLREQLLVINKLSYLEMGEALILYDLYGECAAQELHWHPALEIGARFGCSTLTLARAVSAHSGAPLVSVDPHGWVQTQGHHPASLAALWQNVHAAGLERYVMPVLSRSSVASTVVQGPFCLVFIDGAHDTGSVEVDIGLFYKRVVPGGILCGHDYQQENRSVADAVDDWCVNRKWTLEVRQSIWIVRM